MLGKGSSLLSTAPTAKYLTEEREREGRKEEGKDIQKTKEREIEERNTMIKARRRYYKKQEKKIVQGKKWEGEERDDMLGHLAMERLEAYKRAYHTKENSTTTRS